MAKVNLALLGGFRLQKDSGEPVPLSTKKAGALLAYLALHPGQAQPRPKLAALLWGDRSEVQARDSLRQALSLLRKALSHIDPRALIAHEDTISFEPTALTTDAIVVGDLIAQPGTESLEQAIALYGGELLERRPLLAGGLLGLLIYKPQLGLLIPVALVAGRHWRASNKGVAVSLGERDVAYWHL